MSKIYEDNSLTIGNTPLVRLNKVSKGNVLAKIEARNPSFSVKCRILCFKCYKAWCIELD